MEHGWIYVLVNSTMPGLAKVGRTTRAPLERVAELSAATGVATPFVLAFDQEFADCVLAERLIHAELDRRGLRLSSAREFFRGPPSEIVRVVLEVAAEAADAPAPPPSPSAEALLAEGDRFLFGEGDALQDLTEAVRCYRLAAARGSLMALERLGSIYGRIKTPSRAGRRRAMQMLKNGARRGNYYCYVEMAELFAADRHLENFAKAWALFFTRRREAPRDEVERGTDRFVNALRRYIGNCLALGLAPQFASEMQPEADALARSLLASLDACRDAPEKRQRLVAILHWAHTALLPRGPEPAPAAKAGGWWLRWRPRETAAA